MKLAPAQKIPPGEATGASSLVPVRAARAMGADLVIAVDIYCRGPRTQQGLGALAVVFRKLSARGLAYLRPGAAERETCNHIIMDELVCSTFKPESVAYFQQVIGRLKDQGCDAVVLGCTEIPLIINDGNSPLPTLDSTRLLARAALRRAVQDKAMAA